MPRHTHVVAAVWLSLSLAAGCATYHVGARSLFSPDVQTVFVPVFDSDSYRPFLGEWLTEAVIKEIEKRTPYKVVGTPDADSILSGHIVSDTKHPLVWNKFDEPRELEVSLAIKVSWVTRRGEVLREQTLPVSPEMVDVVQAANVIPEVGQSIATGQQKVIGGLARQIVGLMEMPW